MDMVSKSLTKEQIAQIEARQASAVASSANAAKDPPRFVNGNEGRELTIALEFPVEFDGVVYAEAKIRRPLYREWRAYVRACAEAVRLNGEGAEDLIDQPWLSIPAVVLENLDLVDGTRLEAMMAGFLDQSALPDDEESSSTSQPTTGDPSPSP